METVGGTSGPSASFQLLGGCSPSSAWGMLVRNSVKKDKGRSYSGQRAAKPRVLNTKPKTADHDLLTTPEQEFRVEPEPSGGSTRVRGLEVGVQS